MENFGDGGGPWTAERVEARLIAAFRALPCRPVYSDGRRLHASSAAGNPHAEALNWPARFGVDRGDALVLLTAMRCRAMGESFAAFCDEKGWKRASADRARARACAIIVAGIRDVSG